MIQHKQLPTLNFKLLQLFFFRLKIIIPENFHFFCGFLSVLPCNNYISIKDNFENNLPNAPTLSKLFLKTIFDVNIYSSHHFIRNRACTYRYEKIHVGNFKILN